MKTIYKFEITIGGGTASMPEGAKILAVRAQGQSLFLWAQVDIGKTWLPDCDQDRHIEVYGTGHAIPDTPEREYIGTVFLGDLVWHVLERKDK